MRTKKLPGMPGKRATTLPPLEDKPTIQTIIAEQESRKNSPLATKQEISKEAPAVVQDEYTPLNTQENATPEHIPEENQTEEKE